MRYGEDEVVPGFGMSTKQKATGYAEASKMVVVVGETIPTHAVLSLKAFVCCVILTVFSAYTHHNGKAPHQSGIYFNRP